ncbi:MAG: NAD-dependent epimerase/dehydratase family protein [Deltaproteobacteria bacterium]|nr:NAD-dependent epimerase/dehydratase family protein [Deltaproteobacteria bacterium]
MSTSIITGAAGFIGYALAHRLAQDPEHQLILIDNFLRGEDDKAYAALGERSNVTLLKIDLSAPDAIERLPDVAVDFVFHLAALNGTQNFYERPYEVLKHSTVPTFSLVEKYVTSNKVRSRFLYAGSSEAYASTVTRFNWPVPTAEDVPLSIEDPTNARWSYGVSKLHGEVLTCVACKQFGVPFTAIRYHNVYGPRMGDKHVIPDFVHRMNDQVYSLYGHEDTRSFLYIEDAVAATIQLAKAPAAADQIVNVGSTEEVTIAKLGEMMMRVAGIRAPIELFPSPQGSVKRRAPDVAKLRSITGFEPAWTLERGLAETVAWYRSHPKT